MRLPFIAGNWKMFKTREEVETFARELKEIYVGTDVRTAICAPFVHLSLLKEILEDTKIKIGAQNVHFENEGAYTGEISVPMLEEIGVDFCIVGHSERREYFGETDETVNKKLKRLFNSNIIPILCVGENLQDRDKGEEEKVVENQVVKALSGITSEQVSKLVIAYEPIWAIGTGRNASPEDANKMCGHIRNIVEKLYDDVVSCDLTIQYGGSMKPGNATELMKMEEIDGGLVGGASLVAKDFMQIIDF